MPKPILSDSLFNAEDVATAIVNEANLQITNENLGVTTVTDLVTLISGYTMTEIVSYAFNGFMFVSMHGYGSPISHGFKIGDINTNYTPIADTFFPVISVGPDSATLLQFKTNDTITVNGPDNMGSSNWYFTINGFYRYAS